MKHIIQLWPGDWVKQTIKTNLAVGKKNRLDKSRGKKRLFHPFRRKELWKCIGCILSEFTYGKKGHKIWGETHIFVANKAQTKLLRDVSGKKYIKKVRFDIYCPHYCYYLH